MTPEDMEKLPKPLERLMSDLEMNIMAEIVDRIKDTKKITPAINYLVGRVYDIGVDKQRIKDVIDDALIDVNESVDKIYREALRLDYARNNDIYKSVGKDIKPYSENKWLQQLSNTIRGHTKGSIENITKTTGFNIIRNGQKIFAPLERYLTESLDKAMMNVTIGSKTYTEAINETVDEMTKSGLRTVDYASGRRDRIDVAVRRAILTGVSQLTSSITEQNMKELDTDYAEVDWHLGARNTGIGFENHQSWQGKVYSKSQLKTICGFGDMLGLHGINCRHIIFPFIPGISKRKYTDEWLEEQNRKENEKKDYKGKEFDTYEASQRQRLLERTIRKYKQDIKLLERAEADKNIITLKRAKLKAVEREYVDFSKAMGLKQQGERLRVSNVYNSSEKSPLNTNIKYKDVTSEWKKVKENEAKDVKDLAEWKHNGEVYKVDGKHVVLDYKKEEFNIAKIIAEKYGKEVFMVPRVNEPAGISTPDYRINGENYDLKTISKDATNNTIFNRIQKAKKQSNNFILDLSNCTLDDSIIQSQIEKIYTSIGTKHANKVVLIKDSDVIKAFIKN